MKVLFLPRPRADWGKVFDEGVKILIGRCCLPNVNISSPRATTELRPLSAALNSASDPSSEAFSC